MKRPLLALMAAEAAEVISSLGSLMTLVALPWFVLTTTGSPGRLAGRLGTRRNLLPTTR